MLADMHRLENAARLAMGDFEGPVAPPPRPSLLLTPRPGIFMLVGLVLAVLAGSFLL